MTLALPEPVAVGRAVPSLDAAGGTLERDAFALVVGVPHVVLYVKADVDLDALDLSVLGPSQPAPSRAARGREREFRQGALSVAPRGQDLGAGRRGRDARVRLRRGRVRGRDEPPHGLAPAGFGRDALGRDARGVLREGRRARPRRHAHGRRARRLRGHRWRRSLGPVLARALFRPFRPAPLALGGAGRGARTYTRNPEGAASRPVFPKESPMSFPRFRPRMAVALDRGLHARLRPGPPRAGPGVGSGSRQGGRHGVRTEARRPRGQKGRRNGPEGRAHQARVRPEEHRQGRPPRHRRQALVRLHRAGVRQGDQARRRGKGDPHGRHEELLRARSRRRRFS